jgi:hypothetical protein
MPVNNPLHNRQPDARALEFVGTMQPLKNSK